MLKKVVIPVAGRGTRLLPTTKVQPKEMLPVFSSFKGDILLKPMVQLIFEQLFDFAPLFLMQKNQYYMHMASLCTMHLKL